MNLNVCLLHSVNTICNNITISLYTQTVYRILKLSALCIFAVNFFFLFQLNAHNTLNTYIYHLLPPTCFGVFTTFSGRPLRYLLENYMFFLQWYYVGLTTL
jgi:hypothetical protein